MLNPHDESFLGLRKETTPSVLFISSLLLDKVFGGIFADSVDVADFILELDSVALVCHLHQLRSERGRDELGVVGQPMDHGCEGKYVSMKK